MPPRPSTREIQLGQRQPHHGCPGGDSQHKKFQVGQLDVPGRTSDRVLPILRAVQLQSVRHIGPSRIQAAHRRVSLHEGPQERPPPVEVPVHRGAVRFHQHGALRVRRGGLQAHKGGYILFVSGASQN